MHLKSLVPSEKVSRRFGSASVSFDIAPQRSRNPQLLDRPVIPARLVHAPGSSRPSPPAVPQPQYALPMQSSEFYLPPYLELGYSSEAPRLSLDDRRNIGANIERILKNEKEAAKAPSD